MKKVKRLTPPSQPYHQYMDRGSLSDVLLHKGPIEERVLACVAVQVLRGLQALQ
ncbi:hypothetical protein T492DRAFT_905511, partial [Pavlovales sp. CCMP2436]